MAFINRVGPVVVDPRGNLHLEAFDDDAIVNALLQDPPPALKE